MPQKSLLGEILISEGLITKEQLHQALLEQKKSHKRLGRVLIDLGFVSEDVIINYLSNQMVDILEECEKSIPHLFSKPHDLLMEKGLTHQKIPWEEEEREREIYRRLDAGREKLLKAKEMFKKRIYDEVVFYLYYAMHHIAHVAHDLQEYDNHFSTIRKLGIKSVHTGRSGTSQVERYSTFTDKMSESIKPFTKHYARTMIKDTESYLKRVEKIFDRRKKGL